MRLNLGKANQAKKGLYSGTKELVETLKIDVTLAWCRRHVQNKVSYMNIVEAWCNDWIDAAELAYSIGGPQFCKNMLLDGSWIKSKPRSQASNQGMIRSLAGSPQQAKGPLSPGDFLHLEKAYRPNSWQPQNPPDVRSLSCCHTTHKAKVMCSTR